jgi:hypothetical protein
MASEATSSQQVADGAIAVASVRRAATDAPDRITASVCSRDATSDASLYFGQIGDNR